MYAVIEALGKQVRVEEEKEFLIDLHEGEPGKKIVFKKVLLVQNEEGKSHIGQPFLKGASVEAVLVKHEKGKKIRVFKYKPKKRYRKTIGHRQEFTRVKIKKIVLGGS